MFISKNHIEYLFTSQSHESLDLVAIIGEPNVVGEEVLHVGNVVGPPLSPFQILNQVEAGWHPGLQDPLVDVLVLQLIHAPVHPLHIHTMIITLLLCEGHDTSVASSAVKPLPMGSPSMKSSRRQSSRPLMQTSMKAGTFVKNLVIFRLFFPHLLIRDAAQALPGVADLQSDKS